MQSPPRTLMWIAFTGLMSRQSHTGRGLEPMKLAISLSFHKHPSAIRRFWSWALAGFMLASVPVAAQLKPTNGLETAKTFLRSIYPELKDDKLKLCIEDQATLSNDATLVQFRVQLWSNVKLCQYTPGVPP